jgi:uncharacterized protein YkwD
MSRFAQYLLVLSAIGQSPDTYAQFVEGGESEVVQTMEPIAVNPQPVDAAAVARLIVEQTNEFRAANERPAVEVNPRLTATAEYFAGYMAQHDRYGHNADGNRPSQRATRFGYDYCLISENIAYQYSSIGFATAELAKRFVEGWKNSPGHRENMLDPGVTETGVAVARSDKTGYWYAVQMFGRPASAAIEFSITNRANSVIEYRVADQVFELPPRFTRTHTRCRTSNVTVDFSADEPGETRVEPTSGDHYYIAQQNGRLTILQE